MRVGPDGIARDASSGRRLRAVVVDDAPEFLALVADRLREEGFEVDTARDGRAALELARSREPDLVVLDLGLPDTDGIDVCRQLRTFSQAYVLMLTGRDDELDKVIGLSVGADDYLTKPFSPREMVARVRAMLRRPRTLPAGGDTRRFGQLVIDTVARDVSLAERTVKLTRTEFELLDLLSSKPNAVHTRTALMTAVWGRDWVGDDHVVDVHMSTLRRKLADDPQDPRFIRTVRGVGYAFVGGS